MFFTRATKMLVIYTYKIKNDNCLFFSQREIVIKFSETLYYIANNNLFISRDNILSSIIEVQFPLKLFSSFSVTHQHCTLEY